MIRTFDKVVSSDPILTAISLRLVAVMTTLILGGAFTYWVLDPTIGIDDANITQVYGQAFAERFEFSYYEGGEHVEGSTSLLWTLINALAYLLPGTGEVWITIICVGLTALTLSNCWKLGQITFLGDNHTSTLTYSLLFCGAFLMVPSFFAWSVWALMDISIWLALLSAVLVFSVEQLCAESTPMRRGKFALFATCFALLTITRPEGIAIAIGMLIYLIAHGHFAKQTQARNQYLIALGATVMLFGAVTFWRMSYFGVPFPNTYYAKVTSGMLEQIAAGASYLLKFVQGDLNAILLLAAGLGTALTLNFNRSIWKIVFAPRALLWLFFLGLITLYIALGGDHFGSYRFYQPAFLVLVPIVAGSAYAIVAKVNSDGTRTLNTAAAATGMLLVAFTMFGFSQDSGRLDHEFRIAESGRVLGERLNRLSPGTSIAVISAGGPAMSYKQGPIYDLMGLNWSVMAHAKDDVPNAYINFGNFVEPVFWDTQPDIVVPRLLPSCDVVDRYPTEFWSVALKGMLQSDRFLSEYELICERSVALFAKRDIAERVRGELVST